VLLATFLYNLTKFSFSKDILIAFNRTAAGYHFNTDLSVMEYLDDFKKYFKHYSNYPLLNNKQLNFKKFHFNFRGLIQRFRKTSTRKKTITSRNGDKTKNVN
jgi:hypothetical protein